MASSRILHLILFFSSSSVFLLSPSASSSSISNDVFQPRALMGRSLLQQKEACPVNFESQNYTIVTSQCKGPQYPAKACCEAFKQIGCPFAKELNDDKNDCASTLFSYINLYGKYPPGLFASLCKEGQQGLDCNTVANSSTAQNATSDNDNSWAPGKFTQSPLLMFSTSFLVLVFNLF